MIRKCSVILPIIIRERWQIPMTEACIKIMRENAKEEFELVVVETDSQCFDPKSLQSDYTGDRKSRDMIDVYVRHPTRTSMVKDLNSAIEAATGDFIIHTGNDVYPGPDWLGALNECFDVFPDCGVATLAASDMKQEPRPGIWEGIYGPFMMFERKYTFDTDYLCIGSDTDLIMRAYRDGKRSYRNWRVQVLHFGQATYTGLYSPEKRQAMLEEFNRLFDRKHGDCGLVIFSLLRAGHLI